MVASVQVVFDADLPEYGTKNGRHSGSGGEVTTPVSLWVQAVETAVRRLKESGNVDFSCIKRVCGAGQQHGSVYWTAAGESSLQSLDGGEGSTNSTRDSLILYGIPGRPHRWLVDWLTWSGKPPTLGV